MDNFLIAKWDISKGDYINCDFDYEKGFKRLKKREKLNDLIFIIGIIIGSFGLTLLLLNAISKI